MRRELDSLRSVVGARPVDTVFVGGGTPSLLGAQRLGEVLGAVRSTFGLAPGAEVTTESNPESTSPEFFAELVEAGFTRVSLGMQSAAPHVLRVLERRHTPGRAVAAAREARAAGLAHVNLDLIYGTPGETDDDLRASLDAVLAAGVDHVSAYALIVEDGTALARRVARGELPAPDDDVAAARYELIDDVLSAAGLRWYEVSNWAASAQAAVPAQPRLLARRRLVGAGPGRALAPGGRAVVERQAPGALRGAAGARGVAGGRPRGADRRRTVNRARDAAAAPGVRACRCRCSTTPAARRRSAPPRTACSTRRR